MKDKDKRRDAQSTLRCTTPGSWFGFPAQAGLSGTNSPSPGDGMLGCPGRESEPETWYRVHATTAPSPTALHALKIIYFRCLIFCYVGLAARFLKIPQHLFHMS